MRKWSKCGSGDSHGYAYRMTLHTEGSPKTFTTLELFTRQLCVPIAHWSRSSIVWMFWNLNVWILECFFGFMKDVLFSLLVALCLVLLLRLSGRSHEFCFPRPLLPFCRSTVCPWIRWSVWVATSNTRLWVMSVWPSSWIRIAFHSILRVLKNFTKCCLDWGTWRTNLIYADVRDPIEHRNLLAIHYLNKGPGLLN